MRLKAKAAYFSRAEARWSFMPNGAYPIVSFIPAVAAHAMPDESLRHNSLRLLQSMRNRYPCFGNLPLSGWEVIEIATSRAVHQTGGHALLGM